MKVGILADTHDNMPMIREAVRMFRERGAEAIVHAGDFVAPFALKALLEASIPLTGVFGNNDGEKRGLKSLCETLYEPPHRFELGGRTVVLAHDLLELTDDLIEGADLVVYGHTHSVAIEQGPPLRLNPGEAGGWLSGSATAALVDLWAMTAEIFQLAPQEKR